MQNQLESSRSSLQQTASALRNTGWIAFWIQLGLGIISGAVLLFYLSFRRAGNAASGVPGIGLGVFFAIAGLIMLAIAIFFAFRYTRLARQLRGEGRTEKPSKGMTMKTVRLGLTISLAGMVLTVLGTQAIVGSVLAIALMSPQGMILRTAGVATPMVEPIDLFVVQANLNTITAHLVGIFASFWLLNRLNR
jgi:Protein of unknown function (DUF3611)